MHYFKKFPTLTYTIDRSEYILADITRNIRINNRLTDNDAIYYPYQVKDGEMPEKVSERFYDTQDYYWVVLFVNNIGNIYKDWALPSDILEDEVRRKYDDIFATHHWENAQGLVVEAPKEGQVVYDIFPVTNIEYETILNDVKREIRVVDPRYINEFKKQFERLIIQ